MNDTHVSHQQYLFTPWVSLSVIGIYMPCHCLKEILVPKESSDLLILERCEEEIRDNCRYFTLKTPLFWGGWGVIKKLKEERF